jgi:hypothetical protein
MRSSLTPYALVGVMTFLVVAPTRAQTIQFTLNPASQAYTTVQTVTWSATVVNTSTSLLTFTGISFSGLPTGLTTDDTLYFANLEGTTLGVGGSVTANIFTSSAPSITPGTYDATVALSYSLAGPPVVDSSESALFTSVISAGVIPEPTTLALCSVGLMGLVVKRRSRHD